MNPPTVMDRLERAFGLHSKPEMSRLSTLFWITLGSLVASASILVLLWDVENYLLFLLLCNLAVGLSAFLRGTAGLLRSIHGESSRLLRIFAEGVLPPVYLALFVAQLFVWLA